MDNHKDKAGASAPSFWVPARRALVLGIGAVVGGFAVWVAPHLEPKMTDRYYMVHVSIQRAEKLAMVCHYKQPAKLTDLSGSDDSSLKDAWGKPFRYAVVSNEAGESEHFVWTEWTQDDGRSTLIGAKATADGKTTMFGLPPRD